jgi:hypothetical protein
MLDRERPQRRVDAWAEDAWERCGLPPSSAPSPDWEKCYIRLGDCPPNERSYNERDGCYESGVSVFAGFRTPAGRFLIDLQESVPLAATWLSIRERPAFVALGEVVGTGLCGEPCLREPKLDPIGPGRHVGSMVALPDWFKAWVRDNARRNGVERRRRGALRERRRQTAQAAAALWGRPSCW